MRRFAIPACALLFLAAPMLADDPAKPEEEKEIKLESTQAKVSYGIGNNIGQNLKRQNLPIDLKILLRGIQDALAGKESLLTPEEVQEAFGAMQKEIAENNKKEGADFLAKNKSKAGVKTTKSGLQYEVLKEGNGESPKATDTVSTHYHGTLINGTVFDSSVSRGEPAEFEVGGVIKGWTEALQLMKVGSKWKLYVPAELAYGERGSQGGIGPNTMLIFEVELLEIK